MASSTKYLIDASAIYPLILKLREKVLLYEDNFVILDLTIYEVGNVVWKEYQRGKIRDPTSVMKMFEEIMGGVEKLNIGKGMLEIFEIAAKNNITFYDASYIYIARKRGLKLVTEDHDLLNFPEAISLETMFKELKIQ
ncbi:MAG: type II toxin-antitoxin system VapC family toxin [archaeon YNP-WB-062]|nr:type II toxin-antitoxin system VapC family toxin [Candidatus Culexarchaeum yellowstonense]